MQLISMLFYLIFGYSLIARVLRWLSLWQQKEYRLDRWWAFLRTPQGRKELANIIDLPLSKNSLRRPRLTAKAILILCITLALIGLMLLMPLTVFSLVGMYLVIPVMVMIATIPAWLGTVLIYATFQYMAVSKIKRHQPSIIGVSGSYGKTTTKLLLGALLRQKYQVWVSPKSHNTPLSIAKAISQTYSGQELVVLEYAAYKPGEINYLAKKYPPKMAVFTGINAQHLALFGSWEHLTQAETELFATLPPKSKLFYNDQDPMVTHLVSQFPQLQLVPATQARITQAKLNSQGKLNFTLKGHPRPIKTQLFGKHYLTNLSQAINVALAYGLSVPQIVEAVEQFKPGAEFIQRRTSPQGYQLLIDDRTSNPDGFLTAIELSQHLKAPHKWLFTGGIIDLASAEEAEHERIAQKAAQVFDGIIHTSTVGQKQFQKHFKNNYYPYTSLKKFKQDFRNKFTKESLLVLEGRLPTLITQYLDPT